MLGQVRISTILLVMGSLQGNTIWPQWAVGIKLWLPVSHFMLWLDAIFNKLTHMSWVSSYMMEHFPAFRTLFSPLSFDNSSKQRGNWPVGITITLLSWNLKLTETLLTHLDVNVEALILKKVAFEWLAIHFPKVNKNDGLKFYKFKGICIRLNHGIVPFRMVL